MSRYAFINKDKVQNIIIADSDFISTCGNSIKNIYGAPDGIWILVSDRVGIDYSYSCEIFIDKIIGNKSLELGETLNLFIEAVGNNLNYQWRKDAQNISGATSPYYTKSILTANDRGSYDCIITNSSGSILSEAVDVVVPL